MALTLSLREGDDVFIGGHRVVVWSIVSEHHIILRLEDGTEFDIVDDKTTEILKHVYVGLGKQKQERDLWAKLIFEAPRSITILRGDLMRQGDKRSGHGH